MKRLLLVVGLAGCAAKPEPPPPTEPRPPRVPEALVAAAPQPEPEPAPEPEPTPDPLEGFEGTAAQVLTSRWARPDPNREADLVALGQIRLVPDGTRFGPPPAPTLAKPWTVSVVEEDREPRIVVAGGGIRWLVYVERTDLHPVVIHFTTLHPKPDRPPGPARVELGEGALIVIEEDRVDWLRVALARDPRLRGWIPRFDIGEVHGDPNLPPSDTKPFSMGRLRAATAVASTPGGRERWADLDAGDIVTLVQEPKGKWALVTVDDGCFGTARVTGWVPRAKLELFEGGVGYGCGSGASPQPMTLGAKASLPKVRVEGGRVLLDRSSGAVVGCLERPTDLAQDPGGTLHAPSPWGPLPVALAPEGATETCWQP